MSDVHWMRVTDLEHNVITLNRAQIIAIVVPSPLSRGDGKCRIIGAGMILEVSREQALRLAEDVSLPLMDAGMPES
jgi:hypothetical protein